jgi:thymidylate synthase (FAD)
LLHFLTLRVDGHAQWEIQEYGRVMAGMLKKVAPFSYEAWIDYDVCGAQLSRMELDLLRRVLTPDGEGLRASGAVSGADFEAAGLSKREARELLGKISGQATPDFELDLDASLDASHFQKQFEQALPGADSEPE